MNLQTQTQEEKDLCGSTALSLQAKRAARRPSSLEPWRAEDSYLQDVGDSGLGPQDQPRVGLDVGVLGGLQPRGVLPALRPGANVAHKGGEITGRKKKERKRRERSIDRKID